MEAIVFLFLINIFSPDIQISLLALKFRSLVADPVDQPGDHACNSRIFLIKQKLQGWISRNLILLLPVPAS